MTDKGPREKLQGFPDTQDPIGTRLRPSLIWASRALMSLTYLTSIQVRAQAMWQGLSNERSFRVLL